MKIVNFNIKLPNFGNKNYKNTTIVTKNPGEVFADEKKSTDTTMLDIRCCCNDSNCKSKLSFYYHGLNQYGNSRNLGSDTEISICPDSEEKNGRANNVMWNPSEKNVAKFTAFAETVREAIAFKQELLRGLYAQLQIRIKGYDEMRIFVRKEKTEINFILFEIPNVFSKVPLLRESESYRECLGIIATLPPDTDTSKIKNEHADMKNSFFSPVVEWIRLLGTENELSIEIENIWVMPE